MMIHAGLAPKWTTQMAEQHAREVESRLRNGSYRKLFKQMYGDRPAWSPGLNGLDRERAIINIFRSEEHTSELQSLMRISYAVFCLKKKKTTQTNNQKRK